jgi:hypothetical protein
MKQSNLVKLGLAALTASMFSTSANADIINGNAIANVIAPLLLVETTAMDFGDVAGGTGTGTVVLDLAGGRTVTGDANALPSGLGAAGQFTIQGGAGLAFTLSVSASATMEDGSGNTMVVDTFTENGNAVVLTGAADAFQISGTLNVGASQAAGGYTTVGFTPFTVTANYN